MGKPLTSWENVKIHVKCYFLHPTFRQSLFLQLRCFQQDDHSVWRNFIICLSVVVFWNLRISSWADIWVDCDHLFMR